MPVLVSLSVLMRLLVLRPPTLAFSLHRSLNVSVRKGARMGPLTLAFSLHQSLEDAGVGKGARMPEILRLSLSSCQQFYPRHNASVYFKRF
jgi:hypothetical protein